MIFEVVHMELLPNFQEGNSNAAADIAVPKQLIISNVMQRIIKGMMSPNDTIVIVMQERD